MLLTIGAARVGEKIRDAAMTVVSIAATPAREEEVETPEPEAQPSPAPAPPTPVPPRVEIAPAEPAEPVAPPPILAPSDMPVVDITPPAPARPVYGPPAPPAPANTDTPRVEGAGPNGEPLYAAAWHREPYPEELSGYLSTARGPGWALIACRTVKDFRVEDCVGLAEHPSRSGIANAVLAAAWQFRVRPPQKGGKPMVGEWVRIRIDYGQRRSAYQ